MREQEKSITLLGNQGTKYPQDYAPEVLETFVNKHPDNDYFVKFNCPEFTSLCPITGQPDFEVWGKFTPRGGISIDPYCNYGRPDTKWEQMAEKRMLWHDMYPEKIDNR